jgi:thiamine transport system substrate-binding protein
MSALAILVFAAVFGRWLYFGKQIPREEVLLPKLKVLAYESFTGVAGPGPKLVEKFEETCNCQVELLSTSEAGLLLEKLRLAQDSLRPDVVVGLDRLLLPEAREVTAWKNLAIPNMPWEPAVKEFVQPDFVPVEWSPLTFIWRKGEVEAPRSPAALLEPKYQNAISLEDPRTSTPGLQWLYALYSWVGEGQLAGYLQKLKPNVHSVSPSWSSAYGLFQRRQAKMTFTYVTSLVYHWTIEKNLDYEVASFEQGHPMQMEFAGIPATCRNCELAEKFVNHLLSAESQRQIMSTNYMFPARDGVTEKTPFAQLPKLPLLEDGKQAAFAGNREKLTETWLRSME